MTPQLEYGPEIAKCESAVTQGGKKNALQTLTPFNLLSFSV